MSRTDRDKVSVTDFANKFPFQEHERKNFGPEIPRLSDATTDPLFPRIFGDSFFVCCRSDLKRGRVMGANMYVKGTVHPTRALRSALSLLRSHGAEEDWLGGKRRSNGDETWKVFSISERELISDPCFSTCHPFRRLIQTRVLNRLTRRSVKMESKT